MQPTYNIDNPHLSYEDKQELWETGFSSSKSGWVGSVRLHGRVG